MRLPRWVTGLAVVLPIPFVPGPPAFLGKPAVPRAVHGVAATPRSPFMAANGRSEIHNDAWQTDAYPWGGPLGRSPQTLSTSLGRDCGSITFDRRGRLVTICVGVGGPELFMVDARTLDTLT